MNKISHIITAIKKDLGDGFTVRRSLPTVERKTVGPFVFWDHMGPVQLKKGNEMVVRAHPHIGLATLTFLFSGKILHRDSLNNELEIKPGEVNWMTAGSGIVHSERSSGSGELEGIQLWIALPKDKEDIDPQFDHYKSEEIPSLNFSNTEFKLIAGELAGVKSPVKTYSPLFYLNTKLDKNHSFEIPIPNDQEAAVYVSSGSVVLNSTEYPMGSLIVFELGSSISLQTSNKTNLMIFGGQPFPEKRTVWWNFVSSDTSKIEEAKLKWKNNGFPRVPNETDFIPLPEE